jgi:hypothetical protein
MGTAKSISGYDSRRSGQPTASIKKCCKEPNRSSCSWVAKCPWHHKWTPQIIRSCWWVLLESNMLWRACQSKWNSDDGNNAWNLPGKSNDIWEWYSNSADNCHAFYLFQEILQIIIGCVHNAHTKYEADCLDWQYVINDGNELPCKADMLQFKELWDNNYMLSKDEYHLYNEWTQVTEGWPRHVSIMYGWITDKDKRAWNKDESWFNDSSDNDRRQAFFLAHHQMLAHHLWLSYCPLEAALFWNFEGSKPVCTASINEK